jgi:hypothetical protein
MMRTTKYVLMTIGVLGVVASVYNMIADLDVVINISSFIASLSLVYLGGYKVVPPSAKCKVSVEKTKDFS